MSFRKAREKSGLSQAEVAEMLGVTGAAVCQWEKGKTYPKLPMLRKIAKLYGCTTDELVDDEDDADVSAVRTV